MRRDLRNVLLVQLPIPPPGPEPVRGNVPLAAGYLKLYAEKQGLGEHYAIEIFPARLANDLSDLGLVAAILARDPWLVGFTCYLWNIDRTLWIAERIKQARPEVQIVLGGPEISADNAWVLDHPAVDFAAIGEGEQTFAALLAGLLEADQPKALIPGLHIRPAMRPDGTLAPREAPLFRKPLADLNEISSPYLAGIIDAAEEEMLLLETIRGCIFKCKFCYYPKSYDDLYFVSEEKIVANLRHAREHGAREVVLLDPTLNQRRDFAAFLRLLIRENPGKHFNFFGELRAEGLNAEIAALLHEANFTEVEIGLQSIDPLAMDLMDRKNNLKAFERGIRAMLEVGIKVKVDLIIGLPGDTVESVRRGIRYLRDTGLYTSMQVFNLAILPGTAFRHEAEELGLVFQPRPPYYVLKTPTMTLEQMYDLMAESQDVFETEFDPLPPPTLEFAAEETWNDAARAESDDLVRAWRVNLGDAMPGTPPAVRRTQAFTLWLCAADFTAQQHQAAALITQLLTDNPHTTLQVVLDPTGDPATLTPDVLLTLSEACFRETSYLDRFYAVLPGNPKGAKRLAIVLPWEDRAKLGLDWVDDVAHYAAIAWQGGEGIADDELASHEYLVEKRATPAAPRYESGASAIDQPVAP